MKQVEHVIILPLRHLCPLRLLFPLAGLPKNNNPKDPNSVVFFQNLPNSPIYPWWQITHLFRDTERGGSEWEFDRENMLFNIDSWGFVFNTFIELERVYLNHIKKELGHERVWAVGPVLPIQKGSISTKPEK